MFETYFGIEIEFSGITRRGAAEIVAKVINGRNSGYEVTGPDGRIWKIVYDSSVGGYRRQGNRMVATNDNDYQCELVSPILTYYRDIGVVQAIVRKLRKEGAMTPDTAGIHYQKQEIM